MVLFDTGENTNSENSNKIPCLRRLDIFDHFPVKLRLIKRVALTSIFMSRD